MQLTVDLVTTVCLSVRIFCSIDRHFSPLGNSKGRKMAFLTPKKRVPSRFVTQFSITDFRTGMIGRRHSTTTASSNGHVTFFLTLVMVLVTAWLALRLTSVNHSHTASSLEEVSETNVNVALVETGGSHEEVTAALFYAIASVPGVYTSMYLAPP